MTKVKICGLTEVEPALATAGCGADYLGLVFAPSRRRILPEKAGEIVNAVREAGYRSSIAGVFVNSAAAEVNLIAESCRLDWVQLSGNETWEYCLDIQRPVIKTMHISEACIPGDIIHNIEKGYRLLSRERLMILLDTQGIEAYGGTGRIFDWQIAKEISRLFPVIVAGGLTPENAGKLVREVSPWGVDVSSGVETGGRKDVQKIRDFIYRVKDGGCKFMMNHGEVRESC